MISLAVDDLRAALNRLLEAVEEQFGEELTFEADYYWEVLIPEAFNLGKDPEMAVGRVSDDVAAVPACSWHSFNSPARGRKLTAGRHAHVLRDAGQVKKFIPSRVRSLNLRLIHAEKP